MDTTCTSIDAAAGLFFLYDVEKPHVIAGDTHSTFETELHLKLGHPCIIRAGSFIPFSGV
jgi:hypothetical protein